MIRNMIRISINMIIVLMISFTSCFENFSDSADIELQKTGNLKISVHSAVHLDDGYVLSFDRVSEDSRCPVDAVCIWMGNAKIHLTLTGPGGETQTPNVVPVEFNTSNPVVYENNIWRLELVELMPAPYSDQPLDSNAYRITVNIQQKGE
ncbi:hypothetical protein K1X84_04765 [bacterium]|nr:hypothetical protein [bacterium]